MCLQWGQLLLGVGALTATGMLAASFTLLLLVAINKFLVALQARQVEKKSKQPILIEESPPPTKTMSSPRLSPPIAKGLVRRAGRRRLRQHTRRCTQVFSPSLPGECGYQAALWIAGKQPTKAKVKELRALVANSIIQAYLSDENILGLSIADVLTQEGLTIDEYAAQVKESLWASRIELQAAMDILKTSAIYMDNHMIQKLGKGDPSYAIILRGQHFTVAKVHRSVKIKCGGSVVRGGMHSATTPWQRVQLPQQAVRQSQPFADLLELDTPQPSQEEEQPPDWALAERQEIAAPCQQAPQQSVLPVQEALHYVDTSRMGTEVRGLTIRLQHPAFVKDLRRAVAAATGNPAYYFYITLPDDVEEIPEWAHAPLASRATFRRGVIGSMIVRVYVPQRGYTVLLDAPLVATLSSLKQQLAVLTQQPVDSIIIRDEAGQEAQPSIHPGTTLIATLPLTRAGMRTSPSTTQPYASEQPDHYSDEETSEEIVEARRRDQVEAAGEEYPSPRRSLSRSRSPASSLARGTASPTRHSWHSSAPPAAFPPAQRDSIVKPVIEGDRPVGFVWANPDAQAQEVMRTMQRDLHLACDIHCMPRCAHLWHHVTRLELGPMPELGVPFYVDLRIDRWELFCLPRPIPVMRQGRIEMYVVVPHALDQQLVQRRVDNWQPLIYHHVLMALDADNWVLLRRTHPDRIRGMFDYYEQQLNRGGMQNQSTAAPAEHEPSTARPWADERFKILWAFLPNAVAGDYTPYVVDQNLSVWRFRRFISEVLQVHETEVLLSTFNTPLNLDHFIIRYIDGPIVVQLRQDTFDPGYMANFPIQWPHGPDVDTLSMASAPPSPSIIRTPFCSSATVVLSYETQQQNLQRGGMRNRHMADPRTAMLMWAQQRIARELPHLNQTIIGTLLRADNRMVCSVLNCRSTVQLNEVIVAACRRAGIPELVQPPQAGNEQPQGQQPPPPPPQEHDPRADAAHHPEAAQQGPPLPVALQPLVDAMFQQTVSINNIIHALQNQPTNADFANMTQALYLQNQAQVQAIAGFTAVLTTMEQRLLSLERAHPPVQQDRNDELAEREQAPRTPPEQEEGTRAYPSQATTPLIQEQNDQEMVRQDVQDPSPQRSHSDSRHDESQQPSPQMVVDVDNSQQSQPSVQKAQAQPDQPEQERGEHADHGILARLQERSEQATNARRPSLMPFGRR